jgi:hypothetical protein
MKRILLILAVLLTVSPALADNVTQLMSTGLPSQTAVLIDQLYGSAAGTSIIPATNNSVDLGSASKNFRTLYVATSIIDATGVLVLGKTAVPGDANGSVAYIWGDASSAPNLIVAEGTANATAGIERFLKSRKTDGTADTIVVSGDSLGTISFEGANGAAFDTAAKIVGTVDATPGASTDMPGALTFYTSFKTC